MRVVYHPCKKCGAGTVPTEDYDSAPCKTPKGKVLKEPHIYRYTQYHIEESDLRAAGFIK